MSEVKKYNRLTVLEEYADGIWICRCDCGNIINRHKDRVRYGDTKSCGCMKREANTLKNKASSTHNASKTLGYKLWSNIRARCNAPTHKDYHKYGGRGIRCEWETYEQFAADMLPRQGFSVERKDNNGNYSKDNCIWASATEQAQNRRNNVNIEHAGKTQCLAEWAREVGLAEDTLRVRLYRLGWSVEKALSTPLRGVQP